MFGYFFKNNYCEIRSVHVINLKPCNKIEYLNEYLSKKIKTFMLKINSFVTIF